jgi:hypothetical protein
VAVDAFDQQCVGAERGVQAQQAGVLGELGEVGAQRGGGEGVDHAGCGRCYLFDNSISPWNCMIDNECTGNH